eukprot:scaffold54057_cov62-Attheya_sp.AAC.1
MATGLKRNSKAANLLDRRRSRIPQHKSHTPPRNGADKTYAGKLDAAQEDYRLSSFEMYGIVSSILMGSSLGLISMVDFTAATTTPSEEYDASQKIAWNEDFFVMCAKYVLCIVRRPCPWVESRVTWISCKKRSRIDGEDSCHFGPFRYICSGVVGIVVALLAYDLQCIVNLASKHVFSDDSKKES